MAAMTAYSQSSVMVANFEDDGTDKMFSDRIKEDGMTLIDTNVDNPLQNENNPSTKVMSLTDPRRRTDSYWFCWSVDGECI